MDISNIHKENNQDMKRPALIFNDHIISYAELEQNIIHTANYLSQQWLKPGERAAIALPNCPEFIYFYFGLIRAGGIAVPLNLLQKPVELAFMLSDSGARILVTN